MKPSKRIIAKLSAVDSAFAVSAEDLSTALQRAGAAASDASISFEETVALVTAAKHVTSRAGGVIGNSLKVVFSRLQRDEVLTILREVGVKTHTSRGKPRSSIKVLQDLARIYETIPSEQRIKIIQSVGGVFQMTLANALIEDIANPRGIYRQALTAALSDHS